MASLLLPVKVGILSFTVVCAAMVLKLSLPSVTSLAYSELPYFYYSVLMTWLRPPYLYVIINGIIITIVASSKLHHRKPATDPSLAEFFTDENGVVAVVNKVVVPDEYVVGYEVEETTKVMMTSSERDVVDKVMIDTMNNVVVGDDDVAVSDKISTTEMNSSEFFVVSRSEKPPVSVRTGHRKVKSSSEGGRKLRVSKPKRQETLETTWKTITEGRSMPLNRHLRKSDTWESNGHHVPQNPDPKMTKSDTFHDSSDRHVSTLSPPESLGRLKKEPSGSWKLKKDPSLSQDDLNRRVEAFINKFNEEMRLQRQESLNQYMQMINRGAH